MLKPVIDASCTKRGGGPGAGARLPDCSSSVMMLNLALTCRLYVFPASSL